MPIFSKVYDEWQKTRQTYSLWHRNDFITQHLREAVGQPMIGASGDFSQVTSARSQISMSTPQNNQAVESAVTNPDGPIGCRAFNSIDQTIPNNVATTLNFDSEQFDTGAIHDNVTNNSRLTVSTSGIYVISSTVTWQANAAGYRTLEIQLNGLPAAVIGSEYTAPAMAVNVTQSVSAITRLLAGDYIELVVFQTSGAPLNIIHTAGFLPYFAIAKVG